MPALFRLWPSVAHLESLGDHDLQVDLAVELQGLLQHGVVLIPHPVQAVKHLLVTGAEAEHLAQALVHGAVGVNAEGLVHHVPHGHGVGDDAGHGGPPRCGGGRGRR